MGNIENQKSLRFILLMVAGMIILGAQHSLSSVLGARSFASVVTTVAAFAMIPILRKVWPIAGERPITGKTSVIWSAFLGVLALGLIIIEAPPAILLSWFHAHPVFALLDSAAGGWLLPGALLLVCGGIILIRGKARPNQGGGNSTTH
jgi:hypothetical protein